MTWTPAARAAQAAIDSGWRGYEPQAQTQRIESVLGLDISRISARLFALAGPGAAWLPPIESPDPTQVLSQSLAVYTMRAVYVAWQQSIWMVPIP